jgi:nucleotide-binding universal stress UspA family protein
MTLNGLALEVVCMYDRILLSTDGTVASAEAKSHAIELAAAHDAELHVLYVVDEDVVTAYSGDEYVDGAEGPEHGLEEIGEETLTEVRSEANEAGIDVVTVIRHGQPAETIVKHAADEDVDLLVLGTKHRPEAYRTLLGSVTDRVLRLTTRPATVVKTPVSD